MKTIYDKKVYIILADNKKKTVNVDIHGEIIFQSIEAMGD